MKSFWRWLVALGDAASQVLGWITPIRIDRQWRPYTNTTNESFSGASNRWADVRGWKINQRIDKFFGLFGDKEHCLKADLYDYVRARKKLADVERRIPHVYEELDRLGIDYPESWRS